MGNGFSCEWNEVYRKGEHNSIWPWSDVVSKVNRYFKEMVKNGEGFRVLEIGCGAGANIPFFVSIGADYYGIEGSSIQVEKLNERFCGDRVCVVEGDFTKTVPFDCDFDLILDRGALTYNNTESIKNAIGLLIDHLKKGGLFFSFDLFSFKDYYEHGVVSKEDNNTFVFLDGYLGGLGNVHFFDEKHLKELFSEFEILEMYERTTRWMIPEDVEKSVWNIIAQKE